MGHRRMRTSRVVVGALGAVVVIGGAVCWIKSGRHVTQVAHAEMAPAQPAADRVPAEPPRPVVTPTLVTPAPAPTAARTPAPAPAPAVVSTLAATPATQPVAQIGAGPGASVTSATQPTTQVAPVSFGPPSAVMAQAQSLQSQGKLLEARKLLNGIIQSGGDTDVRAAKQSLTEINKTIVFSTQRFHDDEYGAVYTVKPRESLAVIAAAHGTTWEMLARINGINNPRKLRVGQSIKVIRGPFHALVSKKSFTLDLYLGVPGEPGAVYVMSFPVGLGKDDSTPTGRWIVKPQSKLKNPPYYSPRGEGIIAADDPKNPLGEYWIGLDGVDGHALGKMSYGIHGTIEPDSIGKQASMGCIRLRNDDIAFVYQALVEGKSTVTIRD